MMKFWRLVGLQLNVRYRFSYTLYNLKNDKKARWKALGIGLAVLLALVELVGLYTYLLAKIYQGASEAGMPEILLTQAAVLAGIFILFFGVFYILGTLFLAKDIELLSALPIKSGHLFLSKFILVLTGEYIPAFLLMLPPVIIYGIGEAKGPLYYLIALICILFLPIVPLIVSSLLSLLLMGVVSRGKRRDLLTMAGGLVLIIIVIAGQFFLASRLPEDPVKLMELLLSSSREMVAFTGRVFPPAVWITEALARSGGESLMNLLYLLAASLGALVLVYALASRIYRNGAVASLETQKHGVTKKVSYASGSQWLSFFKTEWRTLLRTPIYALNSLLLIFIGPLLMALPLFGGNLAADPDVKFLFDLINDTRNEGMLILIFAGIFTAFNAMNPAISSTFSREGTCFWILKSLPVSIENQIKGKLLAGYSISFLGAFLMALMALIAFRLSPLTILAAVILSALALYSICAVCLAIDFLRPKLVWNSPTEAIKQNMNVVLGMVAGLLFVFLAGLLGYLLLKASLQPVVLISLMSLILIAACAGSFLLLKKLAGKGYA